MNSRFIIIFSVLTGSLCAQNHPKLSTIIPTLNLPQGYIVESISGRGFVHCIGGASANISSSNPAALFAFDKISFGVSGQWETEIYPATLADIGHNRDKVNLPQSLGTIIPYGNIRLGFGMSQRYNSILDFGLVETTITENPGGTGRELKATKSNIVIASSALAAYSIRNVLHADAGLNIGIECNYNYLNIRQVILSEVLDTYADGWGVSIGLQYGDPDLFQFGVFYERNPFFKKDGEYKIDAIISDSNALSASESQNNRIEKVAYPFSIDSKLPDRLYIGFSIDPAAFLKLSYGVTKSYWKASPGTSKCTQDIWCSMSWNAADNLLLTIGFLSNNRNFEETVVYSWIGQENDCNYLLYGLNWRIRRFDLDLAFMHTTPGSGEWRKQKIVKTAIGFTL